MASSKLVVRHFNPAIDTREVVELERLCETGPSGSMSIFADLMGDPLARVRHFPAYAMLIAEMDDEIVGMIRAGVKEMVCARKKKSSAPRFAKAAYILGLRVSPSKRRMGVALALVTATEAWCVEHGAAFAYMATESSNVASVHLFCDKRGFVRCRTPSLLIHPVFQHAAAPPNWRAVSSGAAPRISRLKPAAAAELYRCFLGNVDFFPRDVDSLLASKRCAGTFLATLAGGSWAILSTWRCNEIFRLQVAGVPKHLRLAAAASRVVDRMLSPFVHVRSFPDIFRPFGALFMFGIHAEGQRGGELVQCLARYARNVAREERCAVVATELGSGDPLVGSIPHWKCMSSLDDLWCVKKLIRDSNLDKDEELEWLNMVPLESPVFVDPRDV